MKKSICILVLYVAVFLAVSSCVFAEGEGTVYVQRDMVSLVRDGKCRVSTGKTDIGKVENVLDGDPSTLLRSASVNPFTITLLMNEPMEADRVRVRFSSDVHEWTMEVADNENDLDRQGKSYRKLINQRRIEDGSLDSVIFEKKIKATAFRLTVKRITGDDYVHVRDWEFPIETRLKDLEVLILNYYPRDSNLRHATEIYENTVITLKATAVPEKGPKLTVTPEVKWTVDGELWMKKPGRYMIKKPGTVRIVAEYGGLKKIHELKVNPTVFENHETDLDVLYIERLPRLDYDGPNGGWPEDGSTVTWRAHVRNWGSERFKTVSYRFRMNNQVVKEGVIENFEPETTRSVEWEWKWHKSRQRIAFQIDTKDKVNELSEFNNRIEDFTDALAVGFYVEEYLWGILHDNQRHLNIGSNSFADWAQRQMREWNELHAEAVYPNCLRGVIDRVRLDRLVVVPNNSLPLAGGIATNNPNNQDKTVDLIWGFESNNAYNGKAWRGKELANHNRAYIGWGHMHELNHARYIIDSYGFDIHPQQVKILLDDDTPLVGSEYFPKGVLRYNKYKGLMGGGVNIYDEYMAFAWNHVAGQRARGGNYNSPTVIGEYLQFHPRKNTFKFIDANGSALSNAEIWIYRSEGDSGGWYAKHYDNVVDMKFRLDEKGEVDLPWTIFAEDGKIIHGYGNANSKVIVRVNYNGKIGFEFIECSDFNIEYMKGHTEHGHYLVTVKNLKELAETESKQAPSSQKP